MVFVRITTILWKFPSALRLNFAGLQRDRFQLLSPEAFATQLKYRGVVKDTVKRAEQGRVLVKILSPKRGILVARKYHVEVAFLVVSPVNQIKEQTCILPVKGTVTYFVHDQTTGTYQSAETGISLSGAPCR